MKTFSFSKEPLNWIVINNRRETDIKRSIGGCYGIYVLQNKNEGRIYRLFVSTISFQSMLLRRYESQYMTDFFFPFSWKDDIETEKHFFCFINVIMYETILYLIV